MRDFVHAHVTWRHVFVGVLAVAAVGLLVWSGAMGSTEKPFPPPEIPRWFMIAVACWSGLVGLTAEGGTRVLMRLLTPVHTDPTRPLPCPRLPFLGRRWARCVTTVVLALIAISTPVAIAGLALTHTLNPASLVAWAGAVAGALMVGLADCWGKDNETTRVGKYLFQPAHNLALDEIGIRERLTRYADWVRLCELNGLDDPSPTIYTTRQCERFREAFEEVLEEIAVWEDELARVEKAEAESTE